MATAKREQRFKAEFLSSRRAGQLMKLGELEAAAVHCRQWLEREPGSRAALRSYLFLLPYLDNGTPDKIQRQTEWAWSAVALPKAARISRVVAAVPRIGWLSADFMDHPVGRNLIPVLEAMNRKFYFYSDSQTPDATTNRFRRLASAWRETGGLSDGEVAELVRQDEVDMLVVLAPRFNENRFAFALNRAAPIQISMHDVATSGLPNMDYFIADRVIVSKQETRHHSERVVRLPSIYIHEPLEAPTLGPVPIMSAGYVTFGCLNNPAKITPSTLRLWGELLAEVKSARLVLGYSDTYDIAGVRSRIVGQLVKAGVAPERLIVHRRKRNRGDHLGLYDTIDIALDPLSFSGSTTTFEALWMGVPVVTMAGNTAASRWSTSMLRALRLDDMIAGSEKGYIEVARRLAGAPEYLAQLRASLRARVAASPLCDSTLRARQLDRLFQTIWRRHARLTSSR